MDGVEILNSYQIVEYAFGINVLGIIFGILSLVGIIVCIDSIERGIFSRALLGFACFAVFLVLGLNALFKDNETEITRYEVTISDEVNYNEFAEKYNVIEERGKILVIEERQ